MNTTIRNLALLGLSVVVPGVAADDLLDVYELALQNDPVIREAAYNRDATLQNKPLALAALLPNISASATASESQSRNLGSSIAFDPNNNFDPIVGRTRGDTESTNASWNLTVNQTLFDWSAFEALRQADAQVAQAEIIYQGAVQDLMTRTLAAYFGVLRSQDELEAQTDNRDALERQLEQTQRRFEVGLIAITDVQESQAAYDNAVALVISAERTLASARETLRTLTGVYHTDLARPLEDLPLERPDPADPEAWVAAANQGNLNLLSARLAAEASRYGMTSARGVLFPTLGLQLSRNQFDNEFTNNLFFNQFTGQFSSQEFPSIGSTNTVGLQLNVPIWQGGRNYANLDRQAALHSASLERAVAAQRSAEQAARDSFLGVISEISRVQALRQALESSRTALEATQAGFDVGTRTTVDVLTSQQALTRAQTNYYDSRYSYISNVLALLLAAGNLSVEDLQEINTWLDQGVGAGGVPLSDD